MASPIAADCAKKAATFQTGDMARESSSYGPGFGGQCVWPLCIMRRFIKIPSARRTRDVRHPSQCWQIKLFRHEFWSLWEAT